MGCTAYWSYNRDRRESVLACIHVVWCVDVRVCGQVVPLDPQPVDAAPRFLDSVDPASASGAVFGRSDGGAMASAASATQHMLRPGLNRCRSLLHSSHVTQAHTHACRQAMFLSRVGVRGCKSVCVCVCVGGCVCMCVCMQIHCQRGTLTARSLLPQTNHAHTRRV